MGFPKASGKHAYPAVIEPAQVIEERKKEGLHPTGPVADGRSSATTRHYGNGSARYRDELRVTAGAGGTTTDVEVPFDTLLNAL